MRYDQLANDLFSLFYQYSNENMVKPTGVELHDLLYLHDCYLYLDRDIQPERLLAASIFAIHRYNEETHYFEQKKRLDFYENVQQLAIKHITGQRLTISMNNFESLPLMASKNSTKLLQEVLHHLKSNNIISTKKNFCDEVGLNYAEIGKNRKNTTKDLLVFLHYCQEHENGWWLHFTVLIENVLFDNLSKYFRSHQRIFTSRAKEIFTRVHHS